MAIQKVCKCGVKKEKGWLYFVDKKGDISRAKMARGGHRKKKKKKAKKRKPKRKKAKKKKKKKRRR